ncbi:MAG: hypothetical protein ACPGJV_10380 [Bacteriovoracaceae bacterium]
MVNVKKFLQAHYRREELISLSKELGCPKTSLVEWYEGRVPGFKNLIYIKKLASIHGLTLDEVLFGTSKKIKKVLNRFVLKDDGRKYFIEVRKE